MEIKKVKYLDQEVLVPILDDNEIEKNEDLEDLLDTTQVIELSGEENE